MYLALSAVLAACGNHGRNNEKHPISPLVTITKEAPVVTITEKAPAPESTT